MQGDLIRSELFLELYNAQNLIGILTIHAISPTAFEYESDCSESWVETYLWNYWISLIPPMISF